MVRKTNGIYPQWGERGFNRDRTQVAFKSIGKVLFLKIDGGEEAVYFIILHTL